MSISEVIKQATLEGRSVTDAIAAYDAAAPITLRELQRQEKEKVTSVALAQPLLRNLSQLWLRD